MTFPPRNTSRAPIEDDGARRLAVLGRCRRRVLLCDQGAPRNAASYQVHGFLTRDGIRFRGLTVNTGPGLLDHLAAVGFDPQYGARPLKRAMERETIAPLVVALSDHRPNALRELV